MKKLLLVIVLLFSALFFTENTQAQTITVSGLTGSCSGANGTYTGPQFSLPLWGKTTGLNQYWIDKSGANWQIRLDGGAVYATSPITNPNIPPCGPWTNVGSCTGTATLTGGCQAASSSCNITHSSGPLNQTVCVGVPITPLTFTTTIATNVSTGNMPPGVSAIFSGNASGGTITVSGTPTSIPTSPPYNPSLFVTAIGGTCTGINTVNFTINLSPKPTVSGASLVQVGSTTTLTGSGTPNTLTPWSSNNANVLVSPTGVVTGVSTGSSIITYTNSSGCQETHSIAVVTPATLSTGDLAFSSFFSDGGDKFSFINMVAIPANTNIFFTDHGWTGTALGNSTSSAEGIIQWTTTSLIPVGSQIEITGLTANMGTVTAIENATSGLNFSAAGDQIFAFQGSTPTFLAGLHYNTITGTSAANWDPTPLGTATTTSTIPAALTTGTNALWSVTEYDNGKIQCNGLPVSDPALLRAYLNDVSNWIFDNDLATIGSTFPNCITLCANSTATISDTICIGQTYTSPSTNYMWTTSGTYMDTIPNASSCDSIITINLTVQGPTVSVTPASATLCVGATVGASISASGATSYSWSPAAGLSATTGSSVSALPSTTTTYIVTGSDASTCTNTASVTVAIAPSPSLDSITANPTAICSGATSQLNTNFVEAPSTFDLYSFNVSSGSALDPMTGASTAVGSGQDDTYISGHAIGFNFFYNGTAYTTFGASSNGFMVLGGAGGSSDLGNGFGTSMLTGNLPMIAPWWDDDHTGTGGITYTTIGTAPNRICIVDFDLEVRYTATANNAKMQVRLHEGTNAIDIVYGPSTALSGPSGSIGLAGTTSTAEMQSVNTSTNTASTTTASNSNTVMPAAGTMYSWIPPTTGGSVTGYAWTPASMVVSSTSASTTTTTLTSTTTFIVTATNMAGCSDTASVEVQVNPLSAATAMATIDTICEGGSTQLDVAISGGGVPYTYVWTPNTGMAPSADSTKNPTANPTTTTTYMVTVTDACNATATSSVTITVNPNPMVMATISDTSICANDTVSLNASGADTYVWNPGSLAGAMQTLTPPGGATTDYIVTGTITTTGCFSTDTVSVTTTIPFYTTASADQTTICLGDTVNLNAMDSIFMVPFCQATYTTGTSSGDYIDSVGGFGGLLQNQTGAGASPYYQLFPTPIAVTAATAYTVTVRNGTFGSQEQAIWIDYNQDSTFQASELVGQVNGIAANALTTFTVNIPTTAYNGPTLMRVMDDYSGPTPVMNPCRAASWGETEDYVLNISGATAAPTPYVYLYDWQPGGLGAMQMVTPTSTTTYVVTQTDSNGCEAQDSVTINVNIPSIVSVTPTSDTICAGATTGVVLTASGANSYNWSPTAGLSATTGATVTATPLNTTTYIVAGTDSNSCIGYDTATITVQQIDSVSALASPANICANANSELTATACYVGKSVFISKVCGFQNSLGWVSPMAPLPTGSALSDPIEITNNSPTDVDMSGWKIEVTGNNAGSFIFPPGNVVPANSALVLERDGTSTVTDIPGVYINTTLGTASSTSASGIILSDVGGNIIDVTAINGYNVVGTGTPAATASDWSGSVASSLGTSGIKRTGTTDNNTAADWVVASNTDTVQYGLVDVAYDPILTCSTSGITFAWSPTTTPTMGDTVTAVGVATTTTYTVTATDGQGCTNSTTVDVIVSPLAPAVATASAMTLCAGDSTQLGVTTSGGGTPYSYTWSPTTGIPTGGDTTSNPMAAPDTTTTYSVTVTDACNNSVTSTVMITVNPTPTILASASDSTVCEGDSTMLTASGADTYVWNPGSLVGAMQTVTPTASTVYIVTGTDTITGCTTDVSVPITFIDEFYVVASASPNPVCAGDSVSLLAMDSVYFGPLCRATYSIGTGFGDFIDSVGGFGGLLQNQTGASASPYYQLFPTPIAVTAATAYTVTVRNGSFGGQEQAIWIDYDQNGIFQNSELVGQVNNIGSNALTTFTVNIPTTAFNGPTLMRVMDNYSGAIPMNPCGTAGYGETEDYTLNISGATAPPAPPVYTYAWTPGSLVGAAQTVGPTANTTYTVTQTDVFGCTAEDSVSIMVNPKPTLAVSASPSASVCIGDTVTLISGAAGNNMLTWNGNTTAGPDTVLAPAISGMYTVIASIDSTGCSVSDSIFVTVNSYPTFSVSATPDTVCAGDSVQLATNPYFSNQYSLSAITHAPVTPTGTITAGPTGDDNTATVTLPFNFDFYGQSKTSLYISTNGFIGFGTPNQGCCTGDVLPGTGGPNDVIAFGWEDLIASTGQIDYFTEGTAPNRKFVVRFNNLPYLGSSNGVPFNGQIVLNETANTIEMHGISGGPNASNNTTQGIENSTGTLATTVPGRNSQSPWSMTNEGWLFTPTPNSGSVAWTPAAGLSDAMISNPTVNPTVTTTFTAAVTKDGCTSYDSVEVVVNQLPTVNASYTPASTLCLGDTAMLMGSGTATSYVWNPGNLVGPNQTVAITQPQYILSGTDAIGCIAYDTVDVVTFPAITVQAMIDSNETCPGSLNGGASAMTMSDSTTVFYENFDSFPVDNATFGPGSEPNAFPNSWVNVQAGDDAQDWYGRSVATGSSNTGPTVDHTSGTGVYVYVEDGFGNNTNVALETPSINLSGYVTASFVYWAHSRTTSTIENEMQVDLFDGTNWIINVDSFGALSTTDTWFERTVDLTPYIGGTIKLRFRGDNSNTSFNHDIAIDDVSVIATTPTSLLWSTSDTTNSIMGLSAGVYTVTATSGHGCTAEDSVIITSNPAPIVTVTPTPGVNNCLGGSVDLIAGGASTYLWMPGSSTNDTLSVPAYTGSNTYTVTGVDTNGCSDTASVVVTQTIPNGNLTQATAGNTASNPGMQTNGFSHPNNGLMYSYFDSACAIISSVQEAAGGLDLGYVSSMATVEATVPMHNGQPYVSRWFQISPTNQGPASVVLYVTQDDFDDYNVVATTNGWPLLPTGSADAAGIANVAITKNDNGGLGVNPIVIIPSGVVWNNPSQRWELTFNTPSFSQFRVHAVNPSNAALAVSYKDFTVTKQANTDLVEWTTVNENNNSQFNVQRSLDGNTYETLGTVKSKAVNGLSAVDLSYSFVDETPAIGHNYYRLQQLDLDNNMTYTKVIDIVWGADGSVVSIYPNPAKDKLNIDISAAGASQTEIKLLDMSGRVVKSILAQTVKGMNNITLEIDDIAVGVYGVQVFENNKLTHVSKIRKK